MSHGIFLDDDPKAAQEAEQREANARAAEMSHHERAAATLEFQGLCLQIAAKGIAFGQTRVGFLTSLADAWDRSLPAYRVLRRASEAAAAPPPPPPAVTIKQEFNDTDPDKVFVRFKADMDAAGRARAEQASAKCPVCGVDVEHKGEDGHEWSPPRCGKMVGDSGWACALTPGHDEPCKP